MDGTLSVSAGNSEYFIKLFRAFNEGNELAFFNAAEAVIADELAANHYHVAKNLKKALGDKKGSLSMDRNNYTLNSVPKDRRNGDELITLSDSTTDESRVFLNRDTKRHIDRVLLENSQRLVLARHGLSPKTKLLFWGPPGCGKTLTASHIAYELGLNIATVRLSSLISSFVGDTASHIQRVFDIASKTPMVLLIDEVDSIGKNRDDPNDVGELKRVVNSLLQAMDSFNSNRSIIVAASNHQYLLDPAVWRRFDDIVHFPLPNRDCRRGLIKRLLNGVSLSGNKEKLIEETSGLSHAEIERVLIESIKTCILEGNTTVSSTSVLSHLSEYKRAIKLAIETRPY